MPRNGHGTAVFLLDNVHPVHIGSLPSMASRYTVHPEHKKTKQCLVFLCLLNSFRMWLNLLIFNKMYRNLVMTSRFKQKTIIITGASAGVGAACARAFAAQKANLVLVARGQQGLDLIKNELSTQTRVLTVAMDVSDTEQCLALFAKAELEFGCVDVLVNNAGMHSRGNLETVSPADVGAMVDINLRAPMMLSCAAIPYLRRAGGGAIVMLGSLAGMAPLQGAATYSGTKAGLRAFTYALADEM